MASLTSPQISTPRTYPGMILLNSDSESSSRHSKSSSISSSDSNSECAIEFEAITTQPASETTEEAILKTESKADIVAKGIFAQEYKKMADEIQSIQSQILSWNAEETQNNLSCRRIFKQHRTKVVRGGLVAGVAGAVSIIPSIVLAALTKNLPLGVGLVASGAFICAGGFLTYCFQGMKLEDEENGIDQDLEDLVSELDHKKETLSFIVEKAFIVDKFYSEMKNFEKDPSENKIKSLLQQIEKLKKIQYYIGSFHEEPFEFIDMEEKMIFVDELCQQLKTGKIFSQLKALKALPVKKILDNDFGEEPWKSLGLARPTKLEFMGFHSKVKRTNPQTVVDKVVQEAMQIFNFEISTRWRPSRMVF